MEKKRQEKVANFKINFSETEDDYVPANEDITSSSQDSESDGAVFGDNSGFETDISSGEENIYPSDKRSVRKRHRLANKRRHRKSKSNRVIFRVVWITMVILVSILLGEYLMVGINDLLAVSSWPCGCRCCACSPMAPACRFCSCAWASLASCRSSS